MPSSGSYTPSSSSRGNRNGGQPQRRSSGGSGGPAGRRRRPTNTSTTHRPTRVSPLEQALDASAASPVETMESFTELGLPERLASTLAKAGITTPNPIQVRTIPAGLAGQDVLGRAQTGAGKTLAFGLPLLARLADSSTGRPGIRRPRALILVPTRELAEQVKEALFPLARQLSLHVTAIYGGAGFKRQIDALERGVDIVVATPGRLEDHIRQGTCVLDRIEITVLDEADYMADLGFMPAVTRLLDQIPAGTQRLLFSATLDRGVEDLAKRYLSEPAVLAVPSTSSAGKMEHISFTVNRDSKVPIAAEIVARPGRTLLFVRTKHGADRLAQQLTRAGIESGAIHGNLRQSQRQKALDAFSAGRMRVLVATDVAARGIHVDEIDLVIHFDPPADSKDYLHRSGRTARAGADGTVLSLLLPDETGSNMRMHRDLGTNVTPIAVHTGHEEVRKLATSGTPIEIKPEPVRAISNGRGPRQPGRPARNGGGQGGYRHGGKPTGGDRSERSGGGYSSAGRPNHTAKTGHRSASTGASRTG
jgi:superfamily II DNA/RNA helicase